jgi:alkyl sulfatase BDS1-like metallo-beta-lactamase superfamily hydrolase
MAVFLAQEWLDLHRKAAEDLPAAPGVSATVDYVVNGAPEGNVFYRTTFEDGRMVEAELGRSTDADLTFTLTYEGAQRLARGDLETGAAFMQGGLKVEGDMAKLLPLLELMHRPDYRAMVGRLADQTEFG